MDKERGEGSSSSIQAPWIPQTPVKPIAPIYPKSTEKQSNCHQTEIGMRLEMNDYEHLSFRDLLHLANTASAHLAAQTPWAYTRTEEPASSWGEWSQKGNEAVETSSVSNDVAQQIKTPEKPKRRKHRPKVVREAKPKQAPKKPAADGKESKTPRRKYVRKKPVVGKGQEATPVEAAVEPPAVETSNEAKKICRRALDFQDESFKPENGEDAESAATGKRLDSGNQESKDGLPLTPSTPKERSRQVKRKGKEPENNGSNQGVDLLMPQAAKRRQAKEPPRDINPSGIQYAELRDYQKMNWLYNTNFQHEAMRFAAICSTSFAGQRLHAREDVSKCYNFTSQPNVNRVVTMEEKGKCTLQGGQHFESTVCSDKAGTPIKKRPTGHARFRNLSAINKATEVCGQLPAGGYSRPHNNNNVLVETRVTLSKKKRNLESGKSRTNKKTVLPNLLQYPASLSASIPPDEIWKRYFSIEAITEKLGVLDINRETALVPHPMNQMILFSSGAGAIVPLTPVKKRRARAKVDLDNETDKVWKLLMENIDNEGVNGSDEQKAKYWEEERSVFRGRADSFIARMHLVQGDRRFTPWKGSVVDSVVGVFLTQNVSDHLSSSAFMSLAAAFPVPSVPSRNFDVGTSSMTSIRITYLDSEESMSNPPVHNQSSVTLNINIQPDEEKDYETSRSSSEIASSAQESVGKTMDLKGSSVEVDKTNQTYLVQELSPSEDSVLTCQESLVSDAPKTIERAGSSSKGEHYPSFVELLQGLKSSELQDKGTEVISVEDSNQKAHYENPRQEVGVSSNPGSSQVSPNTSPGDCCSEVKEPWCFYQQDGDVLSCQKPECSSSIPSTKTKELFTATTIPDINESTSLLDVQQGTKDPPGPIDDANVNAKGKGKKEAFDWDSLRREAQGREGKREKTTRTMDSVDWEAIRTADVSEVAETIKSRGMNHKLAERIQAFLNRLVTEHESIDLEWLRDVPPDKGKEYLMSFRGLGLKSVECVRLLTLHHLAFPVDTNVGRIAVRLGWVPLQPLPESLQLHLLEMYPVLESIQKYLWPRLCKLDQKTLYELHYQMITFGKVFCTKSKPNCNACPMRGECRHFASAFASARLALPGSEKGTETANKNPSPLHLPEPLQREQRSEVVRHSEIPRKVTCCEPIIEEPASPEPECTQVSMADIEDAFYEDPEEIPTIRLDMDAFTSNLKNIMEHNKELQDGNMSSALVALTAQAASIPMPKLKNISQLRTEHQVYELPDSHPLLAELENREPDDPCSYLLAIWTPGETADSVEPAVSKCVSQKFGTLCDEETCFSCNSVKEARSQTVRGTILIPCRTAMRGSFPLNGTYFQVNEVFADHDSSLIPIDVPRQWLWNLPRRTVYFGTSIPSIFKGLPTETIQQCFWRGYVCVRGFDRKTRGPKPLIARLHFPVSKKKSQGNPV